MKPPFALSLSFDGIRLLHRAAGGWRIVGEVALDASDLAGALESLRVKAAGLEPDNMLAKLLLPNEQIKYLTIETRGMDEAARRAAAADALDGATPYAVNDLAFDISVEGDKTHIAAVARETLSEAEAFAVDHNFKPVSFAAIPGDHNYLGEPHFGLTAAAPDLLKKGEELSPDGIAVVVIGQVEAADRPAEDAVEAQADDENEDEAFTDAAKKTVALAPAPPHDAPEISTDPSAKDTPAKIEPPVPVAANAADSAVVPAPKIGFASRRAAEKAKVPSLGGASRVEVAAVTSPVIPQDDTSIQEDAPPPRLSIPPAPPETTTNGFVSKRVSETPPEPIKDASERDRMTVFGARQADVGGKPRFLGLMLTAALMMVPA